MCKLKKNRASYVLLVVMLMLVSHDAVAQCSMCRAALESQQDKSVAEGINNGILFLMAFPYLLVGGLGYYIYKVYSSKKNNEQ
jgi:uncharacterized paraquat-inducible protein A